jgi:hypothetical protein
LSQSRISRDGWSAVEAIKVGGEGEASASHVQESLIKSVFWIAHEIIVSTPV